MNLINQQIFFVHIYKMHYSEKTSAYDMEMVKKNNAVIEKSIFANLEYL